MSNFDRVKRYCDGYRDRLDKYTQVRPQAYGSKRIRVISVSDLHIPFCREDLLEQIIKHHSGAEYCVVNGDLFDNNLISVFPKNKEVPFAMEYAAAMDIVRVLSSNFGKVILVDGNHDYGRHHYQINKMNPTVQFLMKDSPLKYLADGYCFSCKGEDLGRINLPNVTYAGDTGSNWWTRIGTTIFAHRLRGYKKAPMANAIYVAEYFLNRGTDFQCLVSGHSHRVGMAPYKKGRIIIDQGTLSRPLDYEVDGSCHQSPPDLGYAIVEMDSKGNVDPVTTRPVYLGTYQEF